MQNWGILGWQNLAPTSGKHMLVQGLWEPTVMQTRCMSRLVCYHLMKSYCEALQM